MGGSSRRAARVSISMSVTPNLCCGCGCAEIESEGGGVGGGDGDCGPGSRLISKWAALRSDAESVAITVRQVLINKGCSLDSSDRAAGSIPNSVTHLISEMRSR